MQLILLLSLFNNSHQKYLLVDLNNLIWKAIDENGVIIKTGKAVGGSYKCSDAPRSCKTKFGIYSVLKKYGYVRRSDLYPITCKDKKVCGSKMYWQSKIDWSGISIHGVSDKMLPDYNASHGCIRVSIQNAYWLNKYFLEVGTKVIILDY